MAISQFLNMKWGDKWDKYYLGSNFLPMNIVKSFIEAYGKLLQFHDIDHVEDPDIAHSVQRIRIHCSIIMHMIDQINVMRYRSMAIIKYMQKSSTLAADKNSMQTGIFENQLTKIGEYVKKPVLPNIDDPSNLVKEYDLSKLFCGDEYFDENSRAITETSFWTQVRQYWILQFERLTMIERIAFNINLMTEKILNILL